jgi:hypothetical protein
MANRNSTAKSNSTRLIVRVQYLKAFSQIDKYDIRLQHSTTKTLLESVASQKHPVLSEHNELLMRLIALFDATGPGNLMRNRTVAIRLYSQMLNARGFWNALCGFKDALDRQERGQFHDGSQSHQGIEDRTH